MSRILPGNPNLAETLSVARSLGVTVEKVNRTGEIRATHPAWGRSIKINERRKDSPRDLLVAVRRLAGAQP